MLLFSTYIIFLNLIGLVSTTPVKQTLLDEKTENTSLPEAFHEAEMILKRYSYLINSDTDYLVHGILHVLVESPTSLPFVPRHAMDISFSNLAKKLGSDAVEAVTKPILLSIEENYQNKVQQQSKFHLSEEVKEQIEQALDKFLDGGDNNRPL